MPLQEARFEGMSADGRRATFQYGPLDVSWLAPRTPDKIAERWIAVDKYRNAERWIAEAWEKLPVGVQVE